MIICTTPACSTEQTGVSTPDLLCGFRERGDDLRLSFGFLFDTLKELSDIEVKLYVQLIPVENVDTGDHRIDDHLFMLDRGAVVKLRPRHDLVVTVAQFFDQRLLFLNFTFRLLQNRFKLFDLGVYLVDQSREHFL